MGLSTKGGPGARSGACASARAVRRSEGHVRSTSTAEISLAPRRRNLYKRAIRGQFGARIHVATDLDDIPVRPLFERAVLRPHIKEHSDVDHR